ncbi:MAG: MarR family transcriptional regulator [Alphaproteobacteria bacterium]|nr:MAG: MarR family transcriptional regulator [Alphaproteobacteria bacterium]
MTADNQEPKFLDDYLAYLLARASHMVSEDFSPTLKANDIDRAQWRILASLSDLDNVAIGRLARIVLLKQPTLTKVLDRMEKDNLILRQHSREDRRSVKIAITETGRQKVQDLVTEAKAHEKKILETYSSDEQEDLKNTLKTLISRLNDLR